MASPSRCWSTTTASQPRAPTSSCRRCARPTTPTTPRPPGWCSQPDRSPPVGAGHSAADPEESRSPWPASPPAAVGTDADGAHSRLLVESACLPFDRSLMFPSFADLGGPAPLGATLARRGIAEPFPIQAATLPDALAGRDIAGRAPTGSGKTLAFGLAIAAQAAAAGKPRPRRPRALVLVPTRELAAQVQRELQSLIGRDAGPVTTVYGGVGHGPPRPALAQGASAVVACPGRLEDLVGTGDLVPDNPQLLLL